MGAESSSLAGSDPPKKPPLPSNFKPVAVPERDPEAESANLPCHPTEASHFIPYNRHDVAFTSLRLMVYHIDSRSATPIAHLLQQELGDVKAQELLTLFCSSVRGNPRESNGKREIINLAAFKQVCAKIEEARKQHAVRLRRADMQDVDVRYFGSQATIEKFKADKLAVESSNGKPYHLWLVVDEAVRLARTSHRHEHHREDGYPQETVSSQQTCNRRNQDHHQHHASSVRQRDAAHAPGQHLTFPRPHHKFTYLGRAAQRGDCRKQ
ncbi:hypothetical protein BDY17DRAFT_191431 [Neohortaea acidophila]|uniref:Uncharacterized protein n=1 Tax=Neohortaea acidophila TaxID=245834 RepID=A0A6A6PL24_9PEZI|nr:uncharacterized protein BDY17DRAFT_191431 [Neohortaea acidophila]KAF2480364.1 hypothetical protein BDY17DRAFT_191431 [Neohortaea acidophila]